MTNPDLNPAPAALSFGPDLAKVVRTVLGRCKSEHTRRGYAKSIDALDDFADGRPVTRLLLLDWRRWMDRPVEPGNIEKKRPRPPLSVGTINQRLTAIRVLVREARRARLIGGDDMAELLDVAGLPDRGIRRGNWLDVDQARQLLAVPKRNTLRGKRNYCILAILLGCALRRSELVDLDVTHLRKREGRWTFENIRGKGGRVRSVVMPSLVEDAVWDWLVATKILSGRIVRRLDLDPEGLSDSSVMDIVCAAARKIGVPKFSPHDLRRTCSKLARNNGVALEQIQYMLGHASLVTTERYLGGKQNMTDGPGDHLGL